MADINSLPKWATLDRQKCLVALFQRSGGFCVFGHENCQVPEHHYECFIDDLVADWIRADRDQDIADWKAEQKSMHSLGEKRYPLVGRFNAISQRIYADNQPLYFLQGMGVSGLTMRPFAKVRISSSYMRLFIDLADTLRQVSKSRRRKALRYGKPLPVQIEKTIYNIVREAVKDYLAH